MKEREHILDSIPKVYYKPSEIAEELGVYTSCVRYWSKIYKKYLGKTSRPRKYTVKQLEKFRFIYLLERGDKNELVKIIEHDSRN